MGEFKGCHVNIQRMTRGRKRSCNRWSFVIKIKNYALLRLFPSFPSSSSIETVASAHLWSAVGSVRPIRLSREKDRQEAKLNFFSTMRQCYK